jgi:hypothetical protein
MSEMGKDATIPAMLETAAINGLVPKKRIEMKKPNPKATTPTLSADHRRTASKYRAMIMGSKISRVPRRGTDSISEAKTIIFILGILNDSSPTIENFPLNSYYKVKATVSE